MTESLAVLARAFDKSATLGLGAVVTVIGFLLRFVSPLQVLVELWVFSAVGVVVVGVGLLIVTVGIVSFLGDRESVDPSNRRKPISRKEFEKKYSGMSLADSSDSAHTVETLAKSEKPLSRKEIAEASGSSSGHVANKLKSLVSNGYVLEFQVRGTSYYVLSQKGLKLSQDIRAMAEWRKSPPTESSQIKLERSMLQRISHDPKTPYVGGKSAGTQPGLISGKQRILRQQLVLTSGFLGGLFIHFEALFATLMPATPFLLMLATLAWLAFTTLCALKVGGRLGIMTLVLAWISGFIVATGDPFMSLGVMLLISSVAIGAFAA
jgi:DNA-binding HxlR family transcriptional regulator